MIKIRYTNTSDVGGIMYHDSFTPEIYLDVDVGKPIYTYSEEGDELADGGFSRTFARLEKRYSIDTYVQEYILDALMLIQLHNYVEVYLSNGTSMPVKDFKVSNPEWGELDALASVNITFSIFEESISSGCDGQGDAGFGCDDMQIPVVSYRRFINGIDLTHTQRVELDGGEVVDMDTTLALLDLVCDNVPQSQMVFTGSVTENTFNTLKIYADSELLYTKDYYASQINSGEFKIDVPDLTETVVSAMMTTKRAGCDDLMSEVDLIDICGGDIVLEAFYSVDNPDNNFTLILDPDNSSDGGFSDIHFYTQIVIDSVPQGWVLNKIVDKFTENNLQLEITQEPQGSSNISAQVKALSKTHLCDQKESNTIVFSLYVDV